MSGPAGRDPGRGPWRRAGAVLTLLLAAAVAACAGGGTQDGVDPDDATVGIRVQNDLVPPSSVTVRVREQDGADELLGTVEPDGTRTFTFDPAVAAGGYRLVAVQADGQEVVSRPITVSGDALIVWRLSANTVNVTG